MVSETELELTDGALWRRYLETRQPEVLDELVRRHAGLVLGVCRRMLGHGPDADDAFQATFLVLLQGGFRVRKPNSLAAWLYGVAVRIAQRVRRRRGRDGRCVLADAMTELPDPLEQIAHDQELAVLDAELALLPEKYRGPLLRHHWEGQPLRTIAHELQLSESAVDGLLKRGRRELRARLLRRGVEAGAVLGAVHAYQAALSASEWTPLLTKTAHLATEWDAQRLAPSSMPQSKTQPHRLAQEELSMVTSSGFWKTVGLYGVAAAVILVVPFAGWSIVGANDGGRLLSSTLTINDVAPLGSTLMVQLDREPGAVAAASNDAAVPPAIEVSESTFSTAEREIEKKLAEPTEVELADTPLQEALGLLATSLNLQLLIDQTRIEEEGIPIDSPVTLNFKGRLSAALDRILRPRQLDYVIKDDSLIVTTREAANEFVDLRIYRIPLSKQGTPMIDDLEMVRALPHLIGKYDDWSEGGGIGVVYGGDEILLVRTTQRNHRDIEAFWRKLTALRLDRLPLRGAGDGADAAQTNQHRPMLGQATAQITPQKNLLQNATLNEAGSTSQAPAHWQQGAEIEGVEYLWDRTAGRQGGGALGFRKTAQRYFPIADWTQRFDYDGTAKRVRLSAAVKAEKASKAVLDVLFLDEQGEWISHQWAAYIGAKGANDPPANHDWRDYGGVVSIPPKTKTIVVSLQGYGPGTVWFERIEARYTTEKATAVTP